MFEANRQGSDCQDSRVRTVRGGVTGALMGAVWAVCAVCWAPSAYAKPGRASQEVLTGVVTYVTDGDTLWVKLAGSNDGHSNDDSVKVRFQGIDAPEICQSGGDASLAALKAKVLHQTVQLQTSRYDDYGRMLARVSLQGDDVGAWMVERGQAWSYRYRNSPGPYSTQEQTARTARRGVWAVQGAVEPRVFRQQHGSCKL
jgi:micrococcal nuclease